MKDSNDDDSAGYNSVVDGVGESLDDSTPNIAIHSRIGLWHFADVIKLIVYTVDELITQPNPLALILTVGIT